MPRHGTWTETGGGGPGAGILAAVVIAVVLIFGGGAMAAVASAVTELLIVTAVIAGVVVVLGAVALAWWLLKGAPAADAKVAAARLERARVYEVEQARKDALRKQEALELARAGAQPVQIINVIDPAALLGAAFAGAERTYRAEVIRREVER